MEQEDGIRVEFVWGKLDFIRTGFFPTKKAFDSRGRPVPLLIFRLGMFVGNLILPEVKCLQFIQLGSNGFYFILSVFSKVYYCEKSIH
jgi:hypothetical protein